MLSPALKFTVALPSPATTLLMVGALGVVAGTTVNEVDAAPSPTAFSAKILTVYVVPFVKPVTSMGLVSDTGLRVVHVDPLFNEYL